MQKVRLPAHIKPERYEIFIKPNLNSFVFEGEENIELNIEKATKEIVLHAKDLEVSEVAYEVSDIRYKVSDIRLDQKSETATFKFEKKLPKGAGVLKLKFKGILSDQLKGFYRSRYEVGGKEKYMATTQFEATDARRAFPCFDEPAQKAVFDVTLMVPQNLAVISNTIETEIKEHEAGIKAVKFAPTPKMSTYLLAFIVGDFEYIETKSKRGVLVRVFTTPGKKHQAKFALDTAARALDFYEEYFAINYPLPVLDLIAIPDFASAAMENWGAITYRETALLVDDQNTSAANKQWVAIVIAHEIAHQWFGNLVTMHWWTDLWLNEGFASYMEYLATAKLFPEWNLWDQYVAERFAVALRLDALKNTHPIEIEVGHPDEITEIFDQVSYAKGSAVIRMLAEFLGEEDFRGGLRLYLGRHKFSNTTTSDLWKAFEEVSGKPVYKLMQTWTKKAGHPVVSIKDKGKSFELRQGRFFSSAVSRKSARDNTVWQIPVKISGPNGTVQNVLMNKKVAKFPKPSDSWVKFNFGESGVFRSEYDKETFARLEIALGRNELGVRDRLGLVRDSFSLAQAGQFSTVAALNLAKYFKQEEELPVWEELLAWIYSIDRLFVFEKWHKLFQNFEREIFAGIYAKLGWEHKKGEAHTTTLLRSMVLRQMGSAGSAEVIKKAQEFFAEAQKGKSIPVDIRSVVYGLVAENGGEKEFRALVDMYKKAGNMHEEQDRIGRNMGGFKDKKTLAKVIDFALGPDVRIQDSPSIFIQVARNPYGTELAWKYLSRNWKKIYDKYHVGGHLLEWFVVPFSGFSEKKKAKEIEKFFKKNPAPSLARTIEQVKERILSNEAWKKAETKNIAKWLTPK